MNNNKITFLFIFLLANIFSIIYFGPYLIFYFDQQQGEATVENVSGQHLHLKYYHKGLSKEIKIKYRESLTKKRNELASKKKLAIVYSTSFPYKVLIKGYDQHIIQIFIYSLCFIGISLIPLIYFKNFEFTE